MVDLTLPFGDDATARAFAPGAMLLPGFAIALAGEMPAMLAALEQVAPFRRMETPGGFRMSVAMTSCGDVGWTSDRAGYRYRREDPSSGRPWPAMPGAWRALARSAASAAGYPGFEPDSCLVNRYEVGARMSLHQDRDEQDLTQPVVSASFGLPATVLFGGLKRSDRPVRIPLAEGDVVVWGGESRRAFHGIAPLRAGAATTLGPCRINLTFRRAF
jgi:alkylated DNA repair protein (DNA oxidative demethylase)